MKKFIYFSTLIFFFLSFEGMAMDGDGEPPQKRRKIAEAAVPTTPPIYDDVDMKNNVEAFPPTPPIYDDVDMKNNVEAFPPIPPIYDAIEIAQENQSKEITPSTQKKPLLIRNKTRMGESLTKMPRTLKREGALVGNTLKKELQPFKREDALIGGSLIKELQPSKTEDPLSSELLKKKDFLS